jgi:hypothetical protein
MGFAIQLAVMRNLIFLICLVCSCTSFAQFCEKLLVKDNSLGTDYSVNRVFLAMAQETSQSGRFEVRQRLRRLKNVDPRHPSAWALYEAQRRMFDDYSFVVSISGELAIRQFFFDIAEGKYNCTRHHPFAMVWMKSAPLFCFVNALWFGSTLPETSAPMIAFGAVLLNGLIGWYGVNTLANETYRQSEVYTLQEIYEALDENKPFPTNQYLHFHREFRKGLLRTKIFVDLVFSYEDQTPILDVILRIVPTMAKEQ